MEWSRERSDRELVRRSGAGDPPSGARPGARADDIGTAGAAPSPSIHGGVAGAARDAAPGERRVAEPRLDGPAADEQVVELREEELVAHKEPRELGEIHVRTRVEEVPRRVEVEALHEEVVVEHEPIGRAVSERVEPWEEDGALVVPVYEEEVVLVKRLVLREQLRIRRTTATATRVFEETVRREQLDIDDPANTGLVHERYSTRAGADDPNDPARREVDDHDRDGLLDRVVRKAFL